jgi:HlyD family secretion protein
MAEERKQSSRLWLWLGAAVIVVIVYFVARSLTRERLPVREARVSRELLVNNISTNGRVEPLANYPVSSPVATTVKAIYVQQGDQSPPASCCSSSTTRRHALALPAPKAA